MLKYMTKSQRKGSFAKIYLGKRSAKKAELRNYEEMRSELNLLKEGLKRVS